MIQDLVALPPAPAAKARPVAQAAQGAPTSPAGPRAKEPARIDLADAALRAARHMFPDRDLDVSTFHDDQTGRSVVRVADRVSGEVIAQVPSEDLLRFYAASTPDGRPLLTIQA